MYLLKDGGRVGNRRSTKIKFICVFFLGPGAPALNHHILSLPEAFSSITKHESSSRINYLSGVSAGIELGGTAVIECLAEIDVRDSTESSPAQDACLPAIDTNQLI